MFLCFMFNFFMLTKFVFFSSFFPFFDHSLTCTLFSCNQKQFLPKEDSVRSKMNVHIADGCVNWLFAYTFAIIILAIMSGVGVMFSLLWRCRFSHSFKWAYCVMGHRVCLEKNPGSCRRASASAKVYHWLNLQTC